MKLAIINDEVSQSLNAVISLSTAHAFHGVEIRSVWNTPPHRLNHDQCDRVRQMLADAGLVVAGYAPPVFKTPLPTNPASIADAVDSLRSALDLAVRLGSPSLRIFTFFRDGEPNPRAAAEMARSILRRVDIPETVQLNVETGTRTNTPDAATTYEFMEALDDARVGVLWDPGNGVFSGYAQGRDVLAEYALLRPFIRHVHVKDPAGRSGYVELGHGDISWPVVLDRLRADGYAGFLSLETHWRIGRVLTPHQRDEPWGDAFSADGEDASARCMKQLAQWVGVR
ncbi:sugar phosphate isomerase/epimerase family protein [Glycomyces buryatensis]|uniref:Sugar phosphate isomerase/epimerase n=1 Tax=Glycomyces buryatensis TaxID=2570927 RepID=A0A4S8QAK0_9ACTN|nr:sugar phosphate isomerase/epimerase family protein [Glycomyces buryatensis]THV41487.1 sugar phosphate isomerase/epimerase [Glycomyces buryatensis]